MPWRNLSKSGRTLILFHKPRVFSQNKRCFSSKTYFDIDFIPNKTWCFEKSYIVRPLSMKQRLLCFGTQIKSTIILKIFVTRYKTSYAFSFRLNLSQHERCVHAFPVEEQLVVSGLHGTSGVDDVDVIGVLHGNRVKWESVWRSWVRSSPGHWSMRLFL